MLPAPSNLLQNIFLPLKKQLRVNKDLLTQLIGLKRESASGTDLVGHCGFRTDPSQRYEDGTKNNGVDIVAHGPTLRRKINLGQANHLGIPATLLAY
jgi:hypothetical protein